MLLSVTLLSERRPWVFNCASFHSSAGGRATGEEGVVSARKRPAEHNRPQQTSSHIARQPADNRHGMSFSYTNQAVPKVLFKAVSVLSEWETGQMCVSRCQCGGDLVLLKSGVPW